MIVNLAGLLIIAAIIKWFWFSGEKKSDHA